MANTCLKTTLKVSVDNYELETFDKLTIFLPADASPVMKVGTTDINQVTYTCDNDAHFTSADGQTDYGQSYSVPQNYTINDTPNIKVVSGGNPYHVFVSNMSKVTRFELPSSGVVKKDLNILGNYMKLLRCLDIKGQVVSKDFSEQIYIAHNTIYLGLKNPSLNFDISKLPALLYMSTLSLVGSKIYGSLESYVEKITGITVTLTVYSSGILTFNNIKKESGYPYTIKKSDDSITVKNGNTLLGTYDINTGEWTY